jgi:hypothetical protein
MDAIEIIQKLKALIPARPVALLLSDEEYGIVTDTLRPSGGGFYLDGVLLVRKSEVVEVK